MNLNFIDIMASVARVLPEVKIAPKPVSIREKLVWTLSALVIFYVMYNIAAYGFSASRGGMDFLEVITASKRGSLLTVGIGPIVLASIFLQLFKGAGLIDLDLSNVSDRKKFHEAQKVFAVILAFVEAGIFAYTNAQSGYLDVNSVTKQVEPFTIALVILQIAFGAIVLFYLDEVISKYGIGSGISLFIAAGVALAILGGLISLIFDPNVGAITQILSGGADAIPLAIIHLLPFVFTMLVFLVVVYAEGMKVEIPMAYEGARGIINKLPLKFFYTSNVPVIFASALIMNISLFAVPLVNFTKSQVGDYANYLGVVDGNGRMLNDGLLYLIMPMYGEGTGTSEHFRFLLEDRTYTFQIPQWVHALTYISFLILCSVLFGTFWSETSNMDAKSVADQLGTAGLQVPGFRRDPRLTEKVLEKYIGPLIIVSSASVGLLAGLADLTGALGTGTGILLTVGILYKLYEDFEKQNVFGIYPQLSSIFG